MLLDGLGTLTCGLLILRLEGGLTALIPPKRWAYGDVGAISVIEAFIIDKALEPEVTDYTPG